MNSFQLIFRHKEAPEANDFRLPFVLFALLRLNLEDAEAARNP
jgi:hypothetical protein